MDPEVRRAIALLEVRRGDVVVSRGTACLVRPTVALTAFHCVADRQSDPPLFLEGEIRLTFPEHSTVVTIVEGGWDAREDWALLTCTIPEGTIRALPLAALEQDGDTWETYGFPDSKPDGLAVGGRVRNCHGDLSGVPAYQLHSIEAGSGTGLRVRGFSGAPVIVEGTVTGVIRWAPLEGDHDAGGILYACPASLVAARCLEVFPEGAKPISWPRPGPPPTPIADAVTSLARALGRFAALLLMSFAGSIVVLVAGQMSGCTVDDPDEISLVVLIVFSLTILLTRARSRWQRNNGDAGS